MSNLPKLDFAIEGAFAAALATPAPVAKIELSDKDAGTASETIRTDIYNGPHGNGFAVVATVSFANGYTATRVKQSGPETIREKAWPSTDVVALANGIYYRAKEVKQADLFNAAYAALTAIFSSLPAGPQAQFSPVENAIVAAAEKGNWTLAAEILSTAVVPDALAPAQAAMVAALAPYLSVAVSIAAATTIEEVNTVTIP